MRCASRQEGGSQNAHNLDLPVARRVHQRRLTMLVARVDIGAGGKQGINRRQIRGLNGSSPVVDHWLERPMISLDPDPSSAYRLESTSVRVSSS